MVIDTLARTPYSEIGKTFTSATHRVRLPPKVPKRLTIPLPQPKLTVAPGKFSVLTYNLLADLYSNVSCLPRLHLPAVPLLSAVGTGAHVLLHDVWVAGGDVQLPAVDAQLGLQAAEPAGGAGRLQCRHPLFAGKDTWLRA